MRSQVNSTEVYARPWTLLAGLIICTIVTMVLLVGADGTRAEDYEPAEPWEFRSSWGWYEGDRVSYYDLGRATNRTAPAYRLVDAAGTPVEGQHLIFADLRPGVLVGAPVGTGYSDFHRIWDVRVPSGYVPNDYTSMDEIVAANLTMVERDLVWNTPMVPPGTMLVGPEAGEHPLIEGWWAGHRVWYMRFEGTAATPGLFDPGTGLVRSMRALAVFDPPGQLEILDVYPGEATYSPLVRAFLFNPISTEFIADSVRTWSEAEALGFTIFPEGNLYNRPVVGGREEYPRFEPGDPSTYDLKEAWWDETSKVLYYDMGPYGGGNYLYRFVSVEGLPIVAQHYLVDTVSPGVLLGDVETVQYGPLWAFADVVVEDETSFRPDVIKSTDDMRAMNLSVNFTTEFLVAPMIVKGSSFLPEPSNPPGDLIRVWYHGADVYLVELGNSSHVDYDTRTGFVTPRWTNLTYVLDTEGEPYADQRPILGAVEGTEDYSPVWTVWHASGGEGYRTGRFRTVEQLEDRGWSLSPADERILGGFVAGPLNVPAWRPQRFTFQVGPVMNEDGDVVRGATVRVSRGVEVVSGKTDRDGVVTFEVNHTWNGETVQVFVSARDYYTIDFPAEIEDYEHFVPSGGYVPALVVKDVGWSLEQGAWVATSLVLLVVAIILASVIMGRRARTPSISEEEVDAIFSKDVEHGGESEGSKESEEGMALKENNEELSPAGADGDVPDSQDP